jgi:DNA replication protein DnaC
MSRGEQARSIKRQMTIAKLPLAKDVAQFAFDRSPVNESLVRDLATGSFLAQQRNVVLVGGAGTGKTHLAIAIARLHQNRRARPLLQCRRSRQQARGRDPRRPARAHRRSSDTLFQRS